MKKIAVLFFLSILTFCGAKAQKPDSVYISETYIQFIHWSDSLPGVIELSFDEDSMAMELGAAYWASKYDVQSWRDNPHRFFAYDDLAFQKNFDSILVGNQLYGYTFFAPDRYIVIDDGRDTFKNGQEEKAYLRCSSNNWQQYAIDSLNILLLYDAYSHIKYGDDIRLEKLVVPLKDNRYFIDSIATLQPDTLRGNYGALLWSRQHIFDVDTLAVNGKYGLYTLTGKEVIPAVYDSIKTDEVYVRAFNGRKTVLFDYMGKVVKDGIKRAYPVLYRYQVLDNDNHVYWMDRDGQEYSSYRYSIMSVDDQLFPLPYDIVLTPPKKIGSGKKDGYHWVWFKFKSWGNYIEQDENKPLENRLGRQLLFDESGISTLIDEYDKEQFSYLKEYYNNDFDYYRYSSSSQERLLDYNFEVYEIPLKYISPLLVSGKNTLERSGDYRSLCGYWVIAKYKGKYGVVDVRNPQQPILPFVYDKIEGNTISLTLYKNGLKCYYPISEVPRYKELDPLQLREYYIRFTLPNGEKGWLLKNGEEFLDSE